MRSMLKPTVVLLIIVAAVHVQANAQDTKGEALSAKQVRELEKSAVTAGDHHRLAAYYQAQALVAQKNLLDAQELYKKWGQSERASKVPDPYPHSQRLIQEYSAQLEKFSRLSADHDWIATKLEIAEKTMKADAGSDTSTGGQEAITQDNQSSNDVPKQKSPGLFQRCSRLGCR